MCEPSRVDAEMLAAAYTRGRIIGIKHAAWLVQERGLEVVAQAILELDRDATLQDPAHEADPLLLRVWENSGIDSEDVATWDDVKEHLVRAGLIDQGGNTIKQGGT